MQYNSNTVNNAAAQNRSRYSAVNQYANKAYENIDNYISNAKSNKQDIYNQKNNAIQRQTVYKLNTLKSKRNSDINKYTASKQKAYENYYSKVNRTGTARSKLADMNMSDSGYSHVLDTHASDEYTETLKDITKILRDALNTYNLKAENAADTRDEKSSALALQQQKDAQALQSKVVSMLNSVSAKISKLEQQAQTEEQMRKRTIIIRKKEN